MNFSHPRWTALAVTLAVFGAAHLAAALFTPSAQRGTNWPLLGLSVIAVLAGLPFALTAVERQQERIEAQQREIETLHALDTAILREIDTPKLLEVVTQSTLSALDAEAAGIVLFGTTKQKDQEPAGHAPVVAESFALPTRTEAEIKDFQQVVRRGGRSMDEAELFLLPLTDIGDPAKTVERPPIGYVGVARFSTSRGFTSGEKQLLRALMDTISVAVANARAVEKARDSARMEQDLVRERRVGRAFAETLLPPVPARASGWGFSVRYVPQSDEAPIGGDLYDVFELGENRWGVVIADVSGKGLQAARQTALVKYALRAYAREHTAPMEVLTRLNDTLYDEPGLTGFVTLVYGVLETGPSAEGIFTYASAGHEPPALRRAGGEFETLTPTGVVLGAARDMPFSQVAITLHEGDGVLFYTDGLSEARSKESSVFLDTPGVLKMLGDCCDSTPEDMANRILSALHTYTGGKHYDDLALLWVQRVGQ
jgi:serine phosphatase RsbU (regulator of sigma subunit)